MFCNGACCFCSNPCHLNKPLKKEVKDEIKESQPLPVSTTLPEKYEVKQKFGKLVVRKSK